MAQARKKPIVIDYVQWTGSNSIEIAAFTGAKEIEEDFMGSDLIIHTLEGNMKANVGDYIIKGVKGEFYPCKPNIFEATYDLIQGENEDK